MTTTLLTPKIKSKVDWKTLFPMQATKTALDSAQYMKKLTKFSLSSIVYCRGVFSEKCFKFSPYEDMMLPLFKDGVSASEAQFFEEWMKSSFEAFDKRYLRKMILNFYNDASDISTLFESYTFTFNYNKETVIVNTESQDIDPKTKLTEIELSIRDATNEFLKNSLCLLKHLPKLPKSYDISMQLLYHDNVTPQFYEPKGFLPCDSNDVTGLDPKKKFFVGAVKSPFHRVKSTIYRKDFVIDEDDENEMVIRFKNSVQEDDPDKKVETNMDITEDEPKKDNDFEMAEPVIEPDEELDNTIIYECPCRTKDNSEIFKIVRCKKCKKWQHAACFGIPDDAENVEHHCDVCIFKYNIESKNDKMIYMSEKNKKAYCILRCALSHCERFRSVRCSTFEEIFGISKSSAIRLIDILTKRGVFRQITNDDDEGADMTCIVNTQALKNSVIPNYFDISKSSDYNQSFISVNNTSINDDDPPDIFSQEMKGNSNTVEPGISETPKKNDADITYESVNNEGGNVSQIFIPRRSSRKRKQPSYCFDEDEVTSKKKSKSCVVRKLNLSRNKK